MLTNTTHTTKLAVAIASAALSIYACGPGSATPAPGSSPAPASGGSAPAPAGAAARPASGSASAPAPAPRVRMIVPSGTQLKVELESTVSTDTAREGDRVNAVLAESVFLDGFTLDKGAEVSGRVTTVVPAKRVKGRARLVLAFDGVMEKGERISFETEPLDFSAKSTSGKDKKIIGGSAAGGLIVGAIKDGKKGAAIGTLIGAAAGTGAVLVMKGDEVELPRGATLVLEVR